MRALAIYLAVSVTLSPTKSDEINLIWLQSDERAGAGKELAWRCLNIYGRLDLRAHDTRCIIVMCIVHTPASCCAWTKWRIKDGNKSKETTAGKVLDCTNGMMLHSKRLGI